ncbi:hypothetical protein BGX23_012666 [Mortierella sp. AD031]|nr:hypothetical protein BGX23_012666 [Mortierella sp. AD031]
MNWIQLADNSDRSGVRNQEFAMTAPLGCTAYYRTNVESNCLCTPAYTVLCRKDHGTVELEKDAMKCPHFHKSDATLDEDQFTPEWTTVTKDDNYQFFDPGNRWNWNRLVIESIPLDELDRLLFAFVRVAYNNNDPVSCIIERLRDQLRKEESTIYPDDLYINGIQIDNTGITFNHYRIFGRILSYNAVYKDESSIIIDTGQTINLQNRLKTEWRLCNNSTTLKDYGIKPCDVVWVIPGQGGGGGMAPGFNFADVSDRTGIRTTVDHPISDHTTCQYSYPGAKIECNCSCTPDHRVICPTNMGFTDLANKTLACTNCHKSNTIVPVGVGFLQCRYRLHGMKLDGKQFTSEWTSVTRDDGYQYFDPDNQRNWHRLVIETTELRAIDNCRVCLWKLYNDVDTLECGHHLHEGCASKFVGFCPNCYFNQNI